MTESGYDFIDAILSVCRIDTAATTTISLPEIDTVAPYFPETPPAFRDFFRKSNFIQLESPTTLYERGDKLANAITVELKVLPRL